MPDLSRSITAERLINAYAKALRLYLLAEKGLAEATPPIAPELVYAHHLRAKDLQTIRGILEASLTRSEALHVVEEAADA